MTRSMLPETTVALARKLVDQLVADVPGVRAVVLATVDGFEVASAAPRAGLRPDRVAALASSMAAIGQVVSSEALLGEARCVLVETHEGCVLVQNVPCAPVPLVLAVLAGSDCVLGLLKFQAQALAEGLR
jgi:predicted regulator of Ras-like GTPase activity (Roadblock/LC7/MglB family)